MKTLDRASTCLNLFVLVGLAACGGGDAPPAGEEGAGMEGMAPSGEVSSPFAEVDGSAAEGMFVLTPAGGEYTAVVSIETHRGPGDYPVRVHTGSCAAEGTLVRELSSVEGQEGGEGSSRTSFPAADLPAGEYAVRLYDAQAGNALACADLHVM